MKKINRHLALLCVSLSLAITGAAIADTGMTQSQAIDLAKQTLAKEKNLSSSQLQVESVKAVKWPDTSNGCPQPGMMYAQIITPGYRATLLNSATGKLHFVHIGSGRAIICTQTSSTRSRTEKNLRFGQRWQQSQKAKKLLADRLSVPHDDIRIVGTRNIATNSADYNCSEKTSNTHIQMIELTYKNVSYRYAVSGNRLIFCD